MRSDWSTCGVLQPSSVNKLPRGIHSNCTLTSLLFPTATAAQPKKSNSEGCRAEGEVSCRHPRLELSRRGRIMVSGNRTVNATLQGHCGSIRLVWSTTMYKTDPIGKYLLISNKRFGNNSENTVLLLGMSHI